MIKMKSKEQKEMRWFLVIEKYPLLIKSPTFKTKKELMEHRKDNKKLYKNYENIIKGKLIPFKRKVTIPKPITAEEKRNLNKLSDFLNNILKEVKN